MQTLVAYFERQMPNWKFGASGGAVLIEPASRWFGVGGITLSYKPERSTTVELSVSRKAAPSFFLLTGAMLSNVGRVQGIYLFSDRLTLLGSVAYALNASSDDDSLTTQNFTARPSIRYALTRTVGVDLFYSYSWIENKFIQPDFRVSRNQVGFTLTAWWR